MSGQTIGEYRVGADFNPGGDPLVHKAQRLAAELIDFAEDFRSQALDAQLAGEESEETFHWRDECIDVAQRRIEAAAMWLVKAITKPQRK